MYFDTSSKTSRRDYSWLSGPGVPVSRFTELESSRNTSRFADRIEYVILVHSSGIAFWRFESQIIWDYTRNGHIRIFFNVDQSNGIQPRDVQLWLCHTSRKRDKSNKDGTFQSLTTTKRVISVSYSPTLREDIGHPRWGTIVPQVGNDIRVSVKLNQVDQCPFSSSPSKFGSLIMLGSVRRRRRGRESNYK